MEFVAIWTLVYRKNSGLSPWHDQLTSVYLCDHVPDLRPRMLLGMVEARSVYVKETHIHTHRATAMAEHVV